MSHQEQARAMTEEAHSRVLDAVKAEKDAWEQLIAGAMTSGERGLSELIAEANMAYAARVQAQIHYANCRAHLAMAWEARGES